MWRHCLLVPAALSRQLSQLRRSVPAILLVRLARLDLEARSVPVVPLDLAGWNLQFRQLMQTTDRAVLTLFWFLFPFVSFQKCGDGGLCHPRTVGSPSSQGEGKN